jgi:50S ribosomal protein L16 3-hydroxylase
MDGQTSAHSVHGERQRLLGGLTAQAFVSRHWQRQPLLIRGALDAASAAKVIDRKALFALAAQPSVESRLIVRTPKAQGKHASWQLSQGPIRPQQRPKLSTPSWTLLVQGVDLHAQAAHELLQRFNFLPWARLDDVMVSFATDGGGVGPHVDAYDVFLLQVDGRRRWDVGPVAQARWQPDVPLKLLQRFKPTQTWVLEPGDMLYVPPGWGHDGVAQGACLTASVGFRAPSGPELVRDLLPRLAEEALDDGIRPTVDRYQDTPRQAVTQPGRIPASLQRFAQRAMRAALRDERALALALGEWLSEPKPTVWFEASSRPVSAPKPKGSRLAEGALVLDRRTKMIYDTDHLYINGQAFVMGGRDALRLRGLADARRLSGPDHRALSAQAQAELEAWRQNGWLHLA